MYPMIMEKFQLAPGTGIPPLLNRIFTVLSEEGSTGYLVGGLVRDMLLERETGDIDIAVTGDAPRIALKSAKALGGSYVVLDEERGIYRVILCANEKKREIDFSVIRGSIDEDLARRDFTINAMAIEIKPDMNSLRTEEIIDPFGGMEDLGRKTIRVVSEDSFRDDPARLLRAVRLAAELGFLMEPGTEHLVRRDCQMVSGVAGERIREELCRLLGLRGSGALLDFMDRLGILTAIIPELDESKGVDQPTVHHWDVFRHSLKTVTALEAILRQGAWEYIDREMINLVPWTERLEKHFREETAGGSSRLSLLKLAALLHDIAKPETKTLDEGGRARFLGHPQEGSEKVSAILRRLRFSNQEIKSVSLAVQYHLRPQQMSNEGLPTRRAIYRYFRDTGETGIDILFLSLADHLATRGPYLDYRQFEGHVRLVEYVMEERLRKPSEKPPKLLDGNDLIRTLGLSPGPEIGHVLEAVREAQAAGEISNHPQALEYARELLRTGLDSGETL